MNNIYVYSKYVYILDILGLDLIIDCDIVFLFKVYEE